MTLGNRRAIYRARNHFHGIARLFGLAAVLALMGLITRVAREILGR